MTEQSTIKLDEQLLERTRREAERQGMTLDAFVQRLIASSLPSEARPITGRIEDIFDLVTEGEPTDVGRDKDRLIGEAILKHHLEETGQT